MMSPPLSSPATSTPEPRDMTPLHKGGNHLLIKEGSKFSYVLIPSYLSSQNEEPNLCFTNHSNSKWDPKVQQCCLREDGHVHAHVHRGDLIEDILLEQCMDEAGCTLPLPWDLSSSCLNGTLVGDNYSHRGHKVENHVHQEGCGHEQITHGDHCDWLVPMSDGSYLLSHDDGASQHGRLVKIGESQGRLRKHSKQFFDLFKYEGPHAAGCKDWVSAAAFAQCLCCGTSVGYQQAICGSCSAKEQEAETVQSLLDEAVSIDMNDTQPVDLQKTTIDVLGICCPAEVPLVKKILEPVAGVKEVSVNVATKIVTVHHDALVASPAKLVRLLNDAQLEASIHIRGEWKAARKWPTPYTIASGFLMAISMFHYLFGPLKWVALGAVAVGLPPIVMKSFQSLRRFVLDINILMLIAVAGSIGLGDYVEGGLIVFLFTLADWLESRSTDTARMALSSVANLAPQYANLADNGLRLPVAEVKVGTRLSVKAGESIPIDGIIVSGRSAVDESSLTGESFPVEKEVGGSVWAGTINLTGYLCIETSALAEDSAVARMVRLVEDAQTQRSNMDQLVESFAKYYTPTIVISAFAIAIIPVIMHSHHVRHWLYLALVLLVVACPCALVISTPVTTTCAIAQAARTGLIVKGGKFLEALGKIKVVAMDKTGTLTEGCFQVVELQTLNKDADLQKLLRWLSCIESKASHPIASAVVEYARSQGAEPNGVVDDFRTLVGEGVSGIVDGHEISIGNDRLAERLCWKEGELYESSLIEHWKSQGLTICWVGVDRKLELIFSAGDKLREEAAEAVRSMKSLGLHIAMLTGDSLATATAANRKLGEIDVHARLFPEDKVEVLKELKKVGLTAMVGDGINDAPALAAADVGIAMGVAGTAIAMETADIALMKNDLRKLATAVKLGRKARRKILQNVFISFATKILVIVLSVVGYASLWGAVLADVGTCLIVIFNSMLILEKSKHAFWSGLMHRHEHTHKECHKSMKGSKGCAKRDSCCSSLECHGDILTAGQGHVQDCCPPKSCCESEKTHNHGIRRRVNHKDTCAKDCQGVDCSSVAVTISEEPTEIAEHGHACTKKKGCWAGLVSKRVPNACCQQQTVKNCDSSRSSSRCCGKNDKHQHNHTNASRCCGRSNNLQEDSHTLTSAPHFKIDGSGRACEDDKEQAIGCSQGGSSDAEDSCCTSDGLPCSGCGTVTSRAQEGANIRKPKSPAHATSIHGDNQEIYRGYHRSMTATDSACCSDKDREPLFAGISQEGRDQKEMGSSLQTRISHGSCCVGSHLNGIAKNHGNAQEEVCCKEIMNGTESKSRSLCGERCCSRKPVIMGV